MKQRLIIISLLLALFSCSRKNEKPVTLDLTNYSHNSDSVLTIIRSSKDNDYIQIALYADKHIKALKEFKSGHQNGKDILWGPDQNIIVERYFENGKRNRVIREAHNNGRTSFEGERINGLFEGVNNSFYRSGAIKQRWTRQNGKDLGQVISYYENGLIREFGINDSAGYKVIAQWDENGEKRRSVE